MGQEQSKYHVSTDGKVYRINDDGSFTELGNAEDLNNPKQEVTKPNHPRGNPYKPLWIVLALVVAMIGFVILVVSNTNSYNNYSYSEASTQEEYDFKFGGLNLEPDTLYNEFYRGYTDASLYCNGIYEPETDRRYLDVNLSQYLNRNHFVLQANFNPEDTGTILVLSDDYRVLRIYITEDWKLAVSTNNGQHEYSTNIDVQPNEWNHIYAEYFYGRMELNGYTCDNVDMNTEDGDNCLSSIDFSSGRCFKGWLSDIFVFSYFSIN